MAETQRPTCATCRHYVPLTEPITHSTADGMVLRRYTLTGETHGTCCIRADVFLTRRATDRCGEHRPAAVAEHSHDTPSRHEPDPEREADAGGPSVASLEADHLALVTAERDRYRAALQTITREANPGGFIINVARAALEAK